MRTGKFGVVGVGLLSLLSLAGCRSGCGRCGGGTCEGPAGSTGGAGHVASANPVVAETSYGGQRTCPVTGASLAGVPNPLPVVVKGQTVYVCCAHCAAKVKADPDTYLARVAAERSGNAVTSPATSASGPYGGQNSCPVTGEPLDTSGGAIPVTVRGQTVYVCCRACAAKVKANPDTYLPRVIAERAASSPSR